MELTFCGAFLLCSESKRDNRGHTYILELAFCSVSEICRNPVFPYN